MNEIEGGKNTATVKAPCDCPDCPDCVEKAKAQALAPDNSRRKLLFGGVVATSAVVLLSSRPVLAGERTCTASSHASVNLSKPKATHCQGLSPGCWGTTLKWPSPFIAGLPDPTVGGDGWSTMFSVTFNALKNYFKTKYNLTDAKAGEMAQAFKNFNATATMFSSVVPLIPGGGLSMMQALHDNSNQVRRHTTAAVLSAAFFGPATFGYTVQQLIDMILARYANDKANLEADLIMLGGHRGGDCPQDGDGDKNNKINWPVVLNVAV